MMKCCCCSHINSHNQVRGHRIGSTHSGAQEYPREKHKQSKVLHAYITADAIQLTQFMPPPVTYKSEIGSPSTVCQVHTGSYVSLLSPKTEFGIYRLSPNKDNHAYITRSIYHYAYSRQTQFDWKQETKKRKEANGKGRTEKKAKKKQKEKKSKENTRKAKKDKTGRGSKERER